MLARRLAQTVALFLSCSIALAADPAALVAARAHYERGDFFGALAKLNEAQRSPELSEDGLVEVLWLRGASFHALGQSVEAAMAIDDLLKLRPLYEPNPYETPPDLRAAFKQRADAFRKANGVRLGAPALNQANLQVPIEGNVAAAAKVIVFARARGETTYKRFELPIESGSARGTLADAPLWQRAAGAGALDLVIEAHDANSVAIARSGDALKPVAFSLTKEQGGAALSALASADAASAPAELNSAQSVGRPGTKRDLANARTGPPPSPMRLPLLAAGAGGVGLGVVAAALGVVALLFAGAAGGAAGGLYYYLGNVVGSGRLRSTLVPVYLGALPAAGLLVGTAAVLLLAGAVGGAAGVAAFVVRSSL